jgi:hypothetical protein
LRRYTEARPKARAVLALRRRRAADARAARRQLQQLQAPVGQCRLTVLQPALKVRLVSALKTTM